MTINLSVPTTRELKPRIVVFGVGGAGGNAVNNMISAELEGVEFVVANTDAQALANSLAERCIQLGVAMTQGLGAGSRPDVGRAAAEEAIDQIVEQLQSSHMAFITAGMGGGTGTGAAPVIARAAKELNILTVGVVTKPFQFEGAHRMRIAEAGIEELQHYVDTLIIIPNQNLFRVANEKTTFADAFRMADNVLHSGVRGITDLMVMPGLINLDFADVRTVMSEMGKAMMGTGEAEGENRAIEAAERAIANPLLDDISMKGARGVLINITGGPDLTLYEVDEAANRIRNEVDPEANIIVGSTLSDSLAGKMRVSVVATGIDAEAMAEPRPSATVTPFVRPAPARVPAAVPGPGMAHGALAVSMATPMPAAAPAPTASLAPVQAELPVSPPQAAPQALPAVEPPPAALAAEAAARPAPVQAERRDQPFIPPRPMEVAVRRPPLRSPDPFREAEVVNGGSAAEAGKARKRTLIERMAGLARGRTAAEAEPAAETKPRFPLRSEPPALKSTPAAAIPAANPAPATAKAPLLGGLDPADRPAPPRAEDDLLDIPAFLRRQAN
jgi:cell division protein FtsZ